MKKQAHSFSLVEIIIAMGIVVVCITTVLGMIALGMRESNDAVEMFYKNLVIEQIGGLVETFPDFEDSIPNTEPYNKDTSTATIVSAENSCTIQINANDSFLKNVYWNGTSAQTLKMDYKTTLTTGTSSDFSCFAKLWYTPIPVTIDTTDGASVTLDSPELNIEVTWPASLPYANRIVSGNVITAKKVLKQ